MAITLKKELDTPFWSIHEDDVFSKGVEIHRFIMLDRSEMKELAEQMKKEAGF